MEMFLPSKNVLEEICKDKNNLVSTFQTFPKHLTDDNIARLIYSSAFGLKTFVDSFYHLGGNPDKDFNCLFLLDVFQAGFKNAIAHSPKEIETFDYGLFLGDKGLVQGFRDFGNYFKSQKTKDIWENKVPIKSSKKTNFSGCGLSNRFIYKATDSIEVDTKKGILYCVQSHERLEIVPGKFY